MPPNEKETIWVTSFGGHTGAAKQLQKWQHNDKISPREFTPRSIRMLKTQWKLLPRTTTFWKCWMTSLLRWHSLPPVCSKGSTVEGLILNQTRKFWSVLGASYKCMITFIGPPCTSFKEANWTPSDVPKKQPVNLGTPLQTCCRTVKADVVGVKRN